MQQSKTEWSDIYSALEKSVLLGEGEKLCSANDIFW